MKTFTSYLCLLLLLLGAAPLHAQQINVSGRLLSPEGEPIAGASIFTRNMCFGQYSDSSGFFQLRVNQGDTLFLSHLAYCPLKVPVHTDSLGEIVLKERTWELSPVHIVGDASSLMCGGCYLRVSSVEYELNPGLANSPTDLLAGGIRCMSNLGAGASPFYLIDGVPVSGPDQNPLNLLHPANIVSLEVIRGARAQALYGSRAGAGVVLITTRQYDTQPVKLQLQSRLGKVWLPGETGSRQAATLAQEYQLAFTHQRPAHQLQLSLHHRQYPMQQAASRMTGGRLYAHWNVLPEKLRVGIQWMENHSRLPQAALPPNTQLRQAALPGGSYLNRLMHAFGNWQFARWGRLEVKTSQLQANQPLLNPLKQAQLQATLRAETRTQGAELLTSLQAASEYVQAAPGSSLRQQSLTLEADYSLPAMLEASVDGRLEHNRLAEAETGQLAGYVNTSLCMRDLEVDVNCVYARTDLLEASAGMALTPFGRMAYVKGRASQFFFGGQMRLDLAYQHSWSRPGAQNLPYSPEMALFFPIMFNQLEQQGFHADLKYWHDVGAFRVQTEVGFSAGTGLCREQYHLRNYLRWKGASLNWRMEGIRGWKLSAGQGDLFRLAHLELEWKLPPLGGLGLKQLHLNFTGQNLWMQGKRQVLMEQVEISRRQNPLISPFSLSRNLLLGLKVDLI